MDLTIRLQAMRNHHQKLHLQNKLRKIKVYLYNGECIFFYPGYPASLAIVAASFYLLIGAVYFLFVINILVVERRPGQNVILE